MKSIIIVLTENVKIVNSVFGLISRLNLQGKDIVMFRHLNIDSKEVGSFKRALIISDEFNFFNATKFLKENMVGSRPLLLRLTNGIPVEPNDVTAENLKTKLEEIFSVTTSS